MAELLQTHGSHEKRSWRENYDTSLEGRVGRRRKTGQGIMALLSRMHRVGAFLGVGGRHVNHGKEQHPATVPTQRELAAPKLNRALVSGEGSPMARIAVPENPGQPAVVPAASEIRPEVPVAAVVAAHTEQTEYVGAHRRPENLAEYEAALARKAAFVDTVPTEPSTSLEVTSPNGAMSFSGADVEPASHMAEGIHGSSTWNLPLKQRTPGERYNPSEDVIHMSQHDIDARGIVPHDNNYDKPAAPKAPEPDEATWFGGSNARRS